MLANLSPTKSISDTIRDIKANSSKWVNELSNNVGLFEWQKGYGAFTVSFSQLEAVRHYIQYQHEHHRKKTFKEEYIGFLKLHNIEFDYKYLFEAEHCGWSLSPHSRLGYLSLFHRLTPVATYYGRIRG